MVYGIVAEYNPFHKGHRYLIEQVKKRDDFVIAVMSGNFVQRGDFAVLPKWERTRTALENGVDLILELPTPFALKSAPGFAEGAVTVLNSTACVDKLLFGAETADIKLLKQTADLTASPEFEEAIKKELAEGIQFHQAYQNAAGGNLITSPNNLLAIEYMKALNRLDSPIEPIAVKRIGARHDETTPGEYPSASFIRNKLRQTKNDICLMERCDRAIFSKLRSMSKDDFKRIEDVTEGLENRIIDALKTAATVEELYAKIKSKRYTHARIRRIILRAFLGIEKESFPLVPYIRVLGFHERAVPLIKEIKKAASLPVMQKHSDFQKAGGFCKQLYEAECKFTDQYMLGFEPIRPCGLEMTNSILKITD